MRHLITGTAAPSNLRARFENFAKEKEEDDLKRTTEQKRIREEKDRVDREQAQQFQSNGNGVDESAQRAEPKSAINTGRSGGIGNAISMFNKAETKPIVPVQRVSYSMRKLRCL